MRPAAPAVAALALLLSGVAGCSNPTEDYCAALRDEKGLLDRLATRTGSDGGALTRSLGVFERLRDAAPGDLHDEWTSYVNAWQGLAGSLAAAGADPGVFAGGERPPEVGEAEYDAVRDAAERMRSRPVVDAALGIEQHASDVCGVDLGGAGL